MYRFLRRITSPAFFELTRKNLAIPVEGEILCAGMQIYFINPQSLRRAFQDKLGAELNRVRPPLLGLRLPVPTCCG